MTLQQGHLFAMASRARVKAASGHRVLRHAPTARHLMSPKRRTKGDGMKPGGWYVGYAMASFSNGRKPGHFVLRDGREVWMTFDPEWDRPFGLLRGEHVYVK